MAGIFCFVSLFYRNSTKNAENISEITFSEKRRKSIEFTNISREQSEKSMENHRNLKTFSEFCFEKEDVYYYNLQITKEHEKKER